MIKKITISVIVISMIFITGKPLFAKNENYILSHQGIIQEGNTDLVDYDLNQELETYLLKCVQENQSKIDLSAYDITIKEINAIVQEFLNNNPNLYKVAFNQCEVVDQKVINLYPVYEYYRAKTTDPYEQVVSSILSNLNNKMTDLEKILYIHDWMVLNIEYDYENFINGSIPEEAFEAKGALVNKKAVCNGYALAFKDLMNRIGVENVLVSSNYLNHIWNQVKIDGNWYHVDVTWDDPVPDIKGQVYHDNFLVSEQAIIEANHEKIDWTGYRPTNSNKYDNYFWQDVTQEIENYNGFTYTAISGNYQNLSIPISIIKFNINTNEKTIIKEYESIWNDLDNPGYIWIDSYAKSTVANNRIYYNSSHEVRSMALDGSDDNLEVSYNSSTKSLVGVAKEKGKLYYITGDISRFGVINQEYIEFKTFDAPVESIIINPPDSLLVGQTKQLDITVSPSNYTDQNIGYYSSDRSIISIDTSGNMTAHKQGQVTIMVKASNDVSATCTVTVVEPELILGDVNNDFMVNYSDAVLVLQADSGAYILNDQQQRLADMNNDGSINYNDAVLILKIDTGIYEYEQ